MRRLHLVRDPVKEFVCISFARLGRPSARRPIPLKFPPNPHSSRLALARVLSYELMALVRGHKYLIIRMILRRFEANLADYCPGESIRHPS